MNQLSKTGRNFGINGKRFVISIMTASLLIFPMSPAVVLAATDEEAATAAAHATEYLEANQNEDGSIAGYGGETEWSIIAFEASGTDADTVESDAGNSTIEFLESDKPTETTSATTIERKILAINASGKDSKNFDGVDYNQELKDQHNNDQIGEVTLLNDDFFGVLAIDASGDESMMHIAQDSLDYFLEHQKDDGSFTYTTVDCGVYCIPNSNDTAAAIQAMYAAERLGLENIALFSSKDKAIVYLLSTQNEDGGFGYDLVSPSDGSSTAWALMALNLVGSCAKTQALAARNWLITNQNEDGGFGYVAYGSNFSDTYTTAHAVTAILGSSWTLDSAANFSGDQSLSICEKSVVLPLGKTTSNNNDSTIISVLSPTVFAADGIDKNSSEKKTESKKESSEDKNAVLQSADSAWKIAIPVILILVAIAWYLLQSRGKKTGVA